ncbi:MAG: OmpA family protein [Kiritimatiellae bacterium]|nr:OmpA family protein [Kiritimatiellia bacterium]
MGDTEETVSEASGETSGGAGPQGHGAPEHDGLAKLRDLLLEPEIMGLAETRRVVEEIERDIHDPERVTQMLLPVIDKVLTQKVAESRDRVAHAIAPIIDAAIRERIQQDEPSVAATLSPVISDSIRHVAQSQREELTDALYPVVGPSATRYMAESLSRFVYAADAGIRRFFRIGGADTARGVTAFDKKGEAERDLGFLPLAAFLVHRESGRLIAQAPPPDSLDLDPETVPGMLSTVHATVLAQLENAPDRPKVRPIVFDGFTVSVELADSCYVALLMEEGQPTPSYLFQVQQALANIEHHHQEILDASETVSSGVSQHATRILANLIGTPRRRKRSSERTKPYAFMVTFFLVLCAILTPIGFLVYQRVLDRQVETAVADALRATPALSGFPIEAQARRGLIALTGLVSSEALRKEAERIAAAFAESGTVENRIATVAADGVRVHPGMEAVRLASVLSLLADVELAAAAEEEGRVIVRGTLPTAAAQDRVRQAFAQIPGVRDVQMETRVVPPPPDYAQARAEISRMCALLSLAEGVTLSASFKDGNVVLQGTVADASLKPKLQDMFAQIPGVQRVSVLVKQQPPPPAPQEAGPEKDMAKIDALLNVVGGVQVASTLKDGEVTVKGRISDPEMGTRIAQVYLTALGTEAVNTDLRVSRNEAEWSPAAHVTVVTAVLNMLDSVDLATSFKDGTVIVDGTVLDADMTEKVQHVFKKIPGVKNVTGTVRLRNVTLGILIRFAAGSSRLTRPENEKIDQVLDLLTRFPGKTLRILGYAEIGRHSRETQRLALARARAVRDVLVAGGISADRLQVEGAKDPFRPPGLVYPEGFGRTVQFELIQ